MKSGSSSALLNINTGAVGLTATVVAAGIATAFIWKLIAKDKQGVLPYKPGLYPYGRSGMCGARYSVILSTDTFFQLKAKIN